MNAQDELHQPRLRAHSDEPKKERVEEVSNETKSTGTVDEDSKSVGTYPESINKKLTTLYSFYLPLLTDDL